MADSRGMPSGPRVLGCTHRVTHYRGRPKPNGKDVAYHYRLCLGCKRIVLADGAGKPIGLKEEVLNECSL